MFSAEERFHRACNELGWGDARNGLWFVGIEESSEWKSDQRDYIDRYLGHDAYFRDAAVEAATGLSDVTPPQTRSRIATVQSWIAAPLSRSAANAASFEATLWREGSRVAHANIYPLGKAGAGEPFPPDYQELFGYGAASGERERYIQDVKRLRFPRFRAARSELDPQAIVCMGKTSWVDFMEVFQLREENADRSDQRLRVFASEKIVLVPHWAYNHVPLELAGKISCILRSWSVTLP